MFTGDPVSSNAQEPGRHADVDGERRSRFRIRR
jgi:hypothetical protein